MNTKQYEFVMQYLQHKDKITAYTIAYNKRTSNYRAVESAANRLLQNPEIKQYIANMRESMYNEAMQEVQKELKTELLTVHRKREVLARIVNGEHSVIQNFKGKNCQVCTYFLYPTIREILQGIREDNRMAGHYPSPAVVSAKAGKNARYIDSIPRLAQTPLPAGLARFAQNENDVSQSRKYGTTIIPQPVSPLQGDRGKTGEGGQLATDTPQPQNPQSRKYETTNTKLSPSRGSGLQAEGGTLATDTPETENPPTSANIIPQSVSPLQGDRGKTGEGGQLATDTPQPQNPQSRKYGTTNNKLSPVACPDDFGRGVSAADVSPYETMTSHNISPSGVGGLTTSENPEPKKSQHFATNTQNPDPCEMCLPFRGIGGKLPQNIPARFCRKKSNNPPKTV